ncbi:MAG: hypothetical protein ACP5D8_08495 [Fidelibacterota bacterium]
MLEYDNGTLGNYYGAPDSVIIAGNFIHHNSYGLTIKDGTNIMLGENTYYDNILSDTDFHEDVTFIEYTGLEKNQMEIPETFRLISAYPNPFNPTTTLRLLIETPGHLKLSVKDVTGRSVETLYDGYMERGTWELLWEPRHLSTGVYYVVGTINNRSELLKISYLK